MWCSFHDSHPPVGLAVLWAASCESPFPSELFTDLTTIPFLPSPFRLPCSVQMHICNVCKTETTGGSLLAVGWPPWPVTQVCSDCLKLHNSQTGVTVSSLETALLFTLCHCRGWKYFRSSRSLYLFYGNSTIGFFPDRFSWNSKTFFAFQL